MEFVHHLLLVFISCAHGNSGQSLSCPNECVCHDSTLTCAGKIPPVLPLNTTAVHIKDFIRHDLLPEYFSHHSWTGVHRLSIKEKNDEYDSSYAWLVMNNSFENLVNLVHFKCSCPTLDEFGKEALFGLNKLEILDLAGSKQLEIETLEQALVSSKLDAEFTPVPRLQYLDLTDIGSENAHPIDLMENFRMALENKPIKTLNISSTRIGLLSVNSCLEALPVLHTLNMSRMTLLNAVFKNKFLLDNKSLAIRVWDVSAIYYVHTIHQNIRYSKNTSFMQYSPVFNYLEVLILNDISADAYTFNNQYTYIPLEWSQKCRLKSLQSANNGLQWLNISISSGQICPYLENINFDRNSMRFISQDILSCFANLRILRLSDNQLQNMNKYKEFSELFQNNTRLEKIYLARNSFVTLPCNLFRRNIRLKIIDLSFNKLDEVSLNLSHLRDLRLFDLRHNHITTLSEKNILTLNDLFQRQTDAMVTKNVSTTEIDLSDNPLICSCNTKEVIVFLLENYFPSNNTCILDGEVVKIDQKVLSRIEFNCIQIAVIVLICVLTIVVIILFTFFSVSTYRRMKLLKMDEKIRKLTEKYRNHQSVKFIAYLAFCQKDEKIVFDNIHGALEQRLREKLNIHDNRTIVCIADLHFNAGHYIEDQIVKAIDASEVVIFVISKAICRSNWCNFEARVSYIEKKPMLLMLLEEVPTKELPAVFRYQFNVFTRIKWKIKEGEPLLCPGWDSLCNFILENHQLDTNV